VPRHRGAGDGFLVGDQWVKSYRRRVAVGGQSKEARVEANDRFPGTPHQRWTWVPLRGASAYRDSVSRSPPDQGTMLTVDPFNDVRSLPTTRHLMAATGYRRARTDAFRIWRRETCVHRSA
jgi:hypothetical protein